MTSSPIPNELESLRREKGFVLYENGYYECIVGCPNTRPMHRSEALIHDERARHIENVRRFARRLQAVASGQEADSGHDDPALSSSPPAVLRPVPPFRPLQGPQLEHDDPGSIFDDYDGVFLPAEGPRNPADEIDSLYDDLPGLQEISDSSDSEYDTDSESDLNSEGGDEDLPDWRDSEPAPEIPRTPSPNRLRDPHAPAIPAHAAQAKPMTPSTSPPGATGITLRPEALSSDDAMDTQRDAQPREKAGPSRLFHAEHWWPWEDKEAALAAQMSGFPRSVFSEQDMKTALWLAEQCGAPISLSLRQIKLRRDKIIKDYAPNVEDCDGSLGNPYSMLSVADILADEWANPHVRPHVSVLGEDAGERLTAPYNADKWYKEVDAVLSGPMVCSQDGQHYYIHEPALARLSRPTSDDAQELQDNGENYDTVVLPTRWYTRSGDVWARAKRLAWSEDEPSFLIDDREDCVDIPLTSFVASFPRLKSTYQYYNIPDPSLVCGTIRRPNETDTFAPSIDRTTVFESPHPLRVKARGKQIFSVPIWVYCDDTSGNSSKKWNKHNSILFTLAGLPPHLAHLLYNIHFLSTSNLATPLEMYERLVQSIQEIRDKGGIEAYDCHLKTVVLLLPWVLGMAGDNPMQSEFSSHIGLTGKCFCRVCNVRGADSKARPEGDEGEQERVAEFMFRDQKPPRSKDETRKALEEQLKAVLEGAPTRASGIQTDSGVKDKFFMHFFDLLSEECARVKESLHSSSKTPREKSDEVIAAIRVLRQSLPDDLYSPSLRLDEFDPARDTPVEILHVILLGFVKYFWRDAVSRLSREKKNVLKARIDSFDPLGLGVPHPRGHTLVQWAGSLTGRDFRLILQMAPTILQGLLPAEVYEAWLALCRLAPLAFQAGIENKSEYLRLLEEAIYDFLACTALWTTQWFNKPKFHILLHLVEHVRRFGPALLFATESFESYNFVIRLRSIHSPRHAPSMDIARAFAGMHMIRHLASSGLVRDDDGEWRTAGSEVTKLVDNTLYAKLVGISEILQPQATGAVSIDRKRPATTWSASSSARVLSSPPSLLSDADTDTVYYCRKVVLANKDDAVVGGFVLYWPTADTQIPRVGKVVEILATARRVLGLLIQPYTVGGEALPYRMPHLTPSTIRDINGVDVLQPAEWRTVPKCIAAVSTFHNCAAHQCQITRTRITKKERRLMRDKANEVVHATNPDDRILNLAQLRSAETLHPFLLHSRYPPPSKSEHELVRDAVQHRKQVDAEKIKKPVISAESIGANPSKKRPASSHPHASRSRATKRSRTTTATPTPSHAGHAAIHAFATSGYGYIPPSAPGTPFPSTPSLGAAAAHRAAQNRPPHLNFLNAAPQNGVVPDWDAPPSHQTPSTMSHDFNAPQANVRFAPYPGGNRALSVSRASAQPSATHTSYSSELHTHDSEVRMHHMRREAQEEQHDRVGLTGVSRGLAPEDVQRAQDLSNETALTIDSKICILSGELSAVGALFAQLANSMEEMKKSIENMESLMKTNWTPSPALHTALGQVVTYCASRPTHAVSNILNSSVRYVLRHSSEYEIDKIGPLIENALELHIAAHLLNQRKTKVRALVFANTVSSTSLDLMAFQIVDKFWIIPRPKKNEITRETKAHFALMRKVAAPSAGKKNARGADTGFWRTLNTELFRLYEMYGKDRTSAAWLAWQDDIISKDAETYTSSSMPEIVLDEEEED